MSSPWAGCLQDEEPLIWEAIIQLLSTEGSGRSTLPPPGDACTAKAAAGRIESDALRAWAPCRLVCRNWARACGPGNLTSLYVKDPEFPRVEWRLLTSLRLLDLLHMQRPVTVHYLKRLRPLTALTELRMAASAETTPEVLKHLRALSSLVSLEISFPIWGKEEGGPFASGDEGFKALQAMSSLTRLSISSPEVTSAGLAALGKMTNLTALVMCHSNTVTDEGVSHLGNLTTLTELVLNYCTRVGDAGTASLTNLTRLTKLGLRDLPLLTSSGLRVLHNMPGLVSLELGHCHQVTDHGFKELSHNTALEHLVLFSCPITDNGLCSLVRNHPNLTSLELSHNAMVGDTGVMALGSLAGLTSLNISNLGIFCHPGLTHKGLAVLRELPHLTNLTMFGYDGFAEREDSEDEDGEDVRPSPWAGILDGGLPALTHLCAETSGFMFLTDMCPGLVTLTNLETINTTVHRYAKGDLRRKLEAQTSLASLSISLQDPDVEEVLLAIPSLTNLTSLKLECAASEQPWPSLAAALFPLTSLTTLDLSESDRMVDDGILESLLRHKSLTSLDVTECPMVTREGVSRLKAAMPSLLVWDDCGSDDDYDHEERDGNACALFDLFSLAADDSDDY